jgi:hypothetical protein
MEMMKDNNKNSAFLDLRFFGQTPDIWPILDMKIGKKHEISPNPFGAINWHLTVHHSR